MTRTSMNLKSQITPTKLNIDEAMNEIKLEKIPNEKLPDEDIIETMYELLQDHPEIDISMVCHRLRRAGLHVSKKRLKKLLVKTNFPDVTCLLLGNDWTLTVGRRSIDSQEAFKNMPVQNRLDYMNKYEYIFTKICIKLIRLRENLRIFEQINNSFTDEEKLAAEVLKKPIFDYSITIDRVNSISSET